MLFLSVFSYLISTKSKYLLQHSVPETNFHANEKQRGPCEHGNEPFGSVKGGEFIDQLNDC